MVLGVTSMYVPHSSLVTGEHGRMLSKSCISFTEHLSALTFISRCICSLSSLVQFLFATYYLVLIICIILQENRIPFATRGLCPLSPDARRRAASLLDQRLLRSPSPNRGAVWKFNTVNEALVHSSRWKGYTFDVKPEECGEYWFSTLNNLPSFIYLFPIWFIFMLIKVFVTAFLCLSLIRSLFLEWR